MAVELDDTGARCNPEQIIEVDTLTRLAHRTTAHLGNGRSQTPIERAAWELADEWQCFMAG